MVVATDDRAAAAGAGEDLPLYQSFYATEGMAPQRLAEVLALTHVFERRVDREFSEQLEDPGLPNAVHRTFGALLHDEQRHLDWIAAWLRERPELEPLVARYSEVDSRVATAAAVSRSFVGRSRPGRRVPAPLARRTTPSMWPVATWLQRGGMAAKVRSMLSSTAKSSARPSRDSVRPFPASPSSRRPHVPDFVAQ